MATMLPQYQRGMIVQQSSAGGGQQPGGGYHDTHLQVVAGLRSSSNRSNRRCSSSGSSRMPVAGEAITDTAIFESLYNDHQWDLPHFNLPCRHDAAGRQGYKSVRQFSGLSSE